MINRKVQTRMVEVIGINAIDKRNLYLPIPQSAIDANRLGKLRQNYGYDKYDDSVPMWGNWQEAVADEDNLSN